MTALKAKALAYAVEAVSCQLALQKNCLLRLHHWQNTRLLFKALFHKVTSLEFSSSLTLAD